MTELTVLTEEQKNKINHWVKKFPEGKQRSALLPALMLVQEQEGWLSEGQLNAIAEHLDLPPIAVYEVATFYTMYHLKPIGKHIISVCGTLSCMLCGSESITAYFEKKLGIKVGETTKDGKFTLQTVECLAACTNAPMCQIDKTYHLDLTPEKIDTILEELA